jgi:hypothetical protein
MYIVGAQENDLVKQKFLNNFISCKKVKIKGLESLLKVNIETQYEMNILMNVYLLWAFFNLLS